MLCLQYILICQYAIDVQIRDNVRENRRDNKEWTVHRHNQHCAQDTERRKQKTKNITQKTRNISNMDPTKAPGVTLFSEG
jgi:hypothetical protein